MPKRSILRSKQGKPLKKCLEESGKPWTSVSQFKVQKDVENSKKVREKDVFEKPKTSYKKKK